MTNNSSTSVGDIGRLRWIPREERRRLLALFLETANAGRIRRLIRQTAEESLQVGNDRILELWVLDKKEALENKLGAETFKRPYELLLKRLKQGECARARLDQEQVPYAKICQEAVGHGGFHHGVLATRFGRTRWVYDCGSWRKAGRAALKKSIDDFARRCARDRNGHLDLLFVSHFDADHVSGLRQLLEAVPGKTGTVIVPYLGKLGAFSVLGEAAARGRCSSELIEQATDPVGWFHSFGVQRVVQIKAGVPPIEGEGGSIPDLPEGGMDLPTHDDDYTSVILGVDRRPLEMKVRRRTGLSHGLAAPGAVLGVATRIHNWVDWWFVPYAHPIPRAMQKALRLEAERFTKTSIASGIFIQRLRHLLSSREGVRQLKEAYRRAGLTDANAISLSLYVGPRSTTLPYRSILLKDGTRSQKPSGWLLTGDATLGSPSVHPPWIKAFQTFQKSTGMLMLPHHGSEHNFSSLILECVAKAELFVTADFADTTRPNEVVCLLARSQGRSRIRKVSEVRRHRIVEISGPTSVQAKDFPYPHEW